MQGALTDFGKLYLGVVISTVSAYCADSAYFIDNMI